MSFTAFSGRVLFSAIFIFGAWLKYTDEDAFLQTLEPKIGALRSYVPVPEFQLQHLITLAIVVQGLGGILFLFGSSLGAYILLILTAAGTPIVYDFYNYDISSPEYTRELTQFVSNFSLCGALLFFLGMKNYTATKSKKKAVKLKAV